MSVPKTVDNVSCQILESKPDSSSKRCGRTNTPDRHPIAWRATKHNNIPAGLVVHGPRKNTVTQFNGAGDQAET